MLQYQLQVNSITLDVDVAKIEEKKTFNKKKYYSREDMFCMRITVLKKGGGGNCKVVKFNLLYLE